MYDPSGALGGSTIYQPRIRSGGGTIALPFDYYMLHNGFYFQVDKDVPNSAQAVAARRKQFHDHGWPACDDSALSTAFFNLGYAIDVRDARRGDLIGIDWFSGHGHAAFVWDVHTDEHGAVDCLQFVSANGYAAGGTYHGPGISVSAPNDAAAFIDHSDAGYTKKFPLFVDNDLYLTSAWWYCIPGVTRSDIRIDAFRAPVPPVHIVDRPSSGDSAMAKVRAVRFWGFAPPDAPHGDTLRDDTRALATQLREWRVPPPYSVAS